MESHKCDCIPKLVVLAQNLDIPPFSNENTKIILNWLDVSKIVGLMLNSAILSENVEVRMLSFKCST